MTQTELPDTLRGAFVVAVDDSPPAREALRYAAALATAAGKPLHVLTVWNFVTGRGPQQDHDTPPSKDAWQREAQTRLGALVAEELGDVAGATVLAVHGNTVPVLLGVSALAEHLVVDSRGRGGFRGLMLGSTSDQLVRHAESPVTVVREGCTTR